MTCADNQSVNRPEAMCWFGAMCSERPRRVRAKRRGWSCCVTDNQPTGIDGRIRTRGRAIVPCQGDFGGDRKSVGSLRMMARPGHRLHGSARRHAHCSALYPWHYELTLVLRYWSVGPDPSRRACGPPQDDGFYFANKHFVMLRSRRSRRLEASGSKAQDWLEPVSS